LKILKKEAGKITSLEIQGATNIANFGVKLLKDFANRHTNLKPAEMYKDLLLAENIIGKSRATEPAMYNGLEYIMKKVNQEKYKNDPDSTKIALDVSKFYEEYIGILESSKEKIMEIGANRVPMSDKPITIMTHCHSSITTGILIRAFEQGKNFNVICTETRPRYQGRLTAKELIDAGIDTTMISDSAMRWCMRNHEISFILIGADAITSEGTVLNKIGSRLLALASRELHVPFYVATPLLKFNPKSSFGSLEKIDMRPEEEVWPKSERPAKLKILNPAFETISRRYISGLITEAGIFPASSVSTVFKQTYPFLINGTNG
jgi:ribose 1,5-bisphosphate isomerase